MKKLAEIFDKLSIWSGFKRLGIIASIFLVFLFLVYSWRFYNAGYFDRTTNIEGLIGVTISFITMWVFLFVGKWVFEGFSKQITTWFKIKRLGIGASIIMLYMFIVDIGFIYIFKYILNGLVGITYKEIFNLEIVLESFIAMWFCLFFYRFIILGFIKKTKK